MKIRLIIITLFLSNLLTILCHAGVLASSTRIIFEEKTTEKSLMLVNTNAYPVLTQIWVDDGASGPDYDTPYLILPAVFKLQPNEIRGIRIIYNGQKLAKDHESLHWLNIYEIPATSSQIENNNYINLAMNTQMKLFYRPDFLKNYNIDKIISKLEFKIIENSSIMEIINPTPYFISLSNIELININKKNNYQSKHNLIKPLSKIELPIIDSNIKKIEFRVIDEEGLIKSYRKIL